MKRSKAAYFISLALAASVTLSVPAETLLDDGEWTNSVGDLEVEADDPGGYVFQEEVSEELVSEDEFPDVFPDDVIADEETADVPLEEDLLILPEETAGEEILAEEELFDESENVIVEEISAEDADAEISEAGAAQHTYTARYKTPQKMSAVYHGNPSDLRQYNCSLCFPRREDIEVYEDGVLITNWTARVNGVNALDQSALSAIPVDYPFSCEIQILDRDTGKYLTSLYWSLTPISSTLFWYFEDDKADHHKGELPYYEYTGKPVCPKVKWSYFGTFRESSPKEWLYDPTHWNLSEAGPVSLLEKNASKFEVSYENNVEPGLAYCIIKGKKGYGYDNCYGKMAFRIVKKAEDTSVNKTEDTSVNKTKNTSVNKTAPVMTAVYNSAKGADIRWKKVNGAAGYVIYRLRSSEGTKKIATINDADILQFYDTSIRDNCYGRVYSYYVKALYKEGGKTVEGPASQRLILQRIAPMKIVSAKNNTSRGIRLEWKCSVKDNKAQGYEIQYAASREDLSGRKGSFRTITVNGRNNLSRTISNLSKGKTYWIRIRCCSIYTNSATGKQTKTWSQYSNTVKVTIQK